MKISNVVRGADPELFLFDTVSNQPISSIGLIGGSKEFPKQLGGGFAVQEDNVAVEFNIPVADSKDKFSASIGYMVDWCKQEAERIGLSIMIEPSLDFDSSQLADPKAQQLGCDPDYNAWTGEKNPRPDTPPTLRSAGGHLHIGYDNPNKETSSLIVKVHDLFVSLPAMDLDPDVRRRSIYGKAGACRYKEYGVECRTFSNFWIKNKEMSDWLYTQSEKAIDWINKGNLIDKEWGDKIVLAINTNNKSLQKDVMSYYGV